MIAYLKYGAIALLVAGLFGLGWYCGGRANKTELETFRASQESALVTGLRQQLTNAQTESTRRQGVIDVYDKAKADADLSPIAVGVGKRVFVYASSACSAAVPKAASDTVGTTNTSGSTGSPEEFERLFDQLAQAIGHDNAKIIALQEIDR